MAEKSQQHEILHDQEEGIMEIIAKFEQIDVRRKRHLAKIRHDRGIVENNARERW